ncbi:OPT family oligopeptide transporter [Thiorhodovibrio frisius]|uniref:Oligopeptide transporter, OPT superfamily n=1 Tax=Thiorhodovibrio frisius TaxID=631362 RepID=H8Z6H0_9GAMM|nr:OPT family oligopeptide transporter [Thiorhodovibrio frisius]EIC19668.1 oligopeptide transporter, OPT superfamily [Thiorhodovibrio frisius]WPL20364.1 oligopeptide transporter, OPT superfamily [Thiorhodovibrio frisius]
MTAPSPPQLTLRAVLTGFVLGALLAPCNIYSGLKIGWSFNMSIAAALLSYGFWAGLHRLGLARPWGMLENNINQTTASSAASIISAGLVAPIPALTLLTGRELAFPLLALWVFTVSFTGIVMAIGLRRQMLVEEQLPFPNGVAAAETLREIYGRGREAMTRIAWLLGAGLAAGGLKAVDAFWHRLPALTFPWGVDLAAAWGLAAQGVTQLSLRNLGFVLEPSLMMIGFGAIVGARVGLSMFAGALLAWGWLGPWVVAQGWISPGPADPTASWFAPLLDWLLWPGVTLMLVASLTSFGFSLFRLARRWVAQGRGPQRDAPEAEDPRLSIPWSWFWGGLAIALVISIWAQHAIFAIPIGLGLLAVLLTFVLAIVAARVSGETGIPPIGALGKITQVTFGVLAPANTTVNLMAANVTGGAAGQCSDLLHDLKTGQLIGARLRLQSIAQVFGILSGALAGSAAYLVLIPDPQAMLLTAEWPAPAVATWKAVAEVLAAGLSTLPEGTVAAMAVAALAGIALAVAEALVPAERRHWVPSAPALGFAFVIPASISLALCLGALLGVLARALAPDWQRRFLIVAAAGLVAGESLVGVLDALMQMLGGAGRAL